MSTINLAQLLYQAYPDSDLLPIDPQTDLKDLDTLFKHYQTIKDDGEDLFRAVMEEMWDVTRGESEDYRIPVALASLETQRNKIQKVIDAFRAAAAAA